ncbi:MAG: hypothetical protein HKL86_08885 [Acidimicrobiaceae bacterium]|nr:hypothetical protein [Acidimicrobiaceae bacterium]
MTEVIDHALERALFALRDEDVRIGGGASNVPQFLRTGLVDRLHVAIVPVTLGRGERLFENVGRRCEDCEFRESVSSQGVPHCALDRTSQKWQRSGGRCSLRLARLRLE